MRSRTTGAAVFALLFAIAGIAAPLTAEAMVIGFYGSAGMGSTEWDQSGPMMPYGTPYGSEQDTQHTGAGLVMGTGFIYHPMNYRLSIGWEQTKLMGEMGRPDGTLDGVVVDQDITLDLFGGSAPLRVWVGPELRLGYLHGEPGGSGTPGDDFFVLGLGPVFGADFLISPTVGLSWKLGYLWCQYSGSNDYYGGDGSFGDGQAYVSLALLFSTTGQQAYHQQPAVQVLPPPIVVPAPVAPQPGPPPPPPPGFPLWYPPPW